MDGSRKDYTDGDSMAELTPGEKLALLKKKHGTLEEVQQNQSKITFIVYDDEGEIYYKGHTKPEDMRKYKSKKLVEFDSSHLTFMEENGRSMAQFIIEEDEHGTPLVTFRPVDKPTYDVDKEFLSEVLSDDSDDFDIKINVQQTKFIVHLNSKKKVKDNIVLYITSTSDPHILYEKLNIDITDLQKHKVMEYKKDYNLNEFSIYTRKLYDKYVRS